MLIRYLNVNYFSSLSLKLSDKVRMSFALVMTSCLAVLMSVSCFFTIMSLAFKRASMLPTLSVTSLVSSTSARSRRESSAVRVLTFPVSLSSFWILSTTSFESPCCKAERQCGFATFIILNYDCCKRCHF